MEQQHVIHCTMESIQFMFLTTIFSQSFSLSLTVLDPAERFFKIITNLLSFSNKGIFALLSNDFILVNQSFPHKANCQSLEPEMSRENSINLDDPDRSPSKKQLNPEPEPDPEPPAAPPYVGLPNSTQIPRSIESGFDIARIQECSDITRLTMFQDHHPFRKQQGTRTSTAPLSGTTCCGPCNYVIFVVCTFCCPLQVHRS